MASCDPAELVATRVEPRNSRKQRVTQLSTCNRPRWPAVQAGCIRGSAWTSQQFGFRAALSVPRTAGEARLDDRKKMRTLGAGRRGAAIRAPDFERRPRRPGNTHMRTAGGFSATACFIRKTLRAAGAGVTKRVEPCDQILPAMERRPARRVNF